MPENVEIKARASDWAGQLGIAGALCGSPTELLQTDTFYRTPEGRLKLRETEGSESYLIFYRRPNASGPKSSVYFTARVPDPAAAKTLFGAALGAGRTVKKKRLLFIYGRTRIHFDEVEDLGRFLELEVCLAPGEDRAAGEAEAEALMERLGIAGTDLLSSAYADMLNERELPS